VLTVKESQQLVLLDWAFAVSGTKSYSKQKVTGMFLLCWMDGTHLFSYRHVTKIIMLTFKEDS